MRRDIGVRTPLATVEKLIAPASASVVLGAMAGPVLGTAVQVMKELGHRRGIAIQGMEGGVIPSVRRRTRGIELDGEHQVPLTVDPADHGLDCASDPDLPMFGPPEEDHGSGDNPLLVSAAGDATRAVLHGDLGAARNASLLGAAVILKAAAIAPTIADGVATATESLDGGRALEVLEHLRRLSRV
jgi:anthranilate phosphoribosyltransferase